VAPHAEKDLPCRTRGSAVTKGDWRKASPTSWEWRAIVAGKPFPWMRILPLPIEIVESEGGHFPGPMPSRAT